MRIDEVRVQNFKSIQDSGWVSLEDDLTALVGENEAGKSNFLEALSYIGESANEVPREDLCQETVDDRWDVNMSDCEFLSVRFSETVFNNTEYQVLSTISSKLISNNIIHIKADLSYCSSFNTNEKRKILLQPKIDSSLISKESDLLESFNQLGEARRICSSQNSDHDRLIAINNLLNSVFKNANIIDKSYTKIVNSSEVFTQIKQLQSHIRMNREKQFKMTEFEKQLLPTTPIYTRLNLVQNKTEKKHKNSKMPYKPIIRALEGGDSKGENMSRRRRDDQLKEISETLTEGFNRYWDQAEIEFSIESESNEVAIKITENVAGDETLTYPEDRSEGFRWFLSFYLQLMNLDGSSGVDNDLILLDDPGTYLHPRGQKDLREALSELATDTQIVYSTHSPYMLDPDETREIKLVQRNSKVDDEDGHRPGTVVHTDLSQANAPGYDTLAPVRAALGAEYADSLFASTANLLVEGYTDETYLKRLSKVFTENTDTGENGGDDPDDHEGDTERNDGTAGLPEECSVLQMSGGDNTTALVRLLEAEGYDYYVLLDSDGGGEINHDKLDDIGTPENRIGHVADFLPEAVDNAEIEDLFGDELLIELFTESHDTVDEEAFADAFDGTEKFSRRACAAVNQVRGQSGENADFAGSDLAKEAMAQDLDRRFAHGELTLDDLTEETQCSFRELFADVRAAVE